MRNLLIQQLYVHFSKRRRWQLFGLLLVMLASGVAEIFSLASVLPFLGVLTNPELLWGVTTIRNLAGLIGIQQPSQLLIPFILLFGIVTLMAASVRLMNLWLNERLAAAIGSDLSCETYRRSLYQPYSVHVGRNSTSVILASTTQITETVEVIKNILQLTTSSVVAVGLFSALMVINLQLSLIIVVVFGFAYGVLTFSTKQRLHENSVVMARASQRQLKALQEGLGAIRDVILDSSQPLYLDIYRQEDLPLRLKKAESVFLGAFPRFALEALGMLVIALMALLLTWQGVNSMQVIALIGTFALGFQRLLPALQQLYASLALIRTYRAAVNDVLGMLNQQISKQSLQATGFQLYIESNLEIQQLSYGFSSNKSFVLEDIGFEIHRGERIGIIGTTGSGKSTLVDIIMGLLEPTSGRILVNGLDLHDTDHPERLQAWRSTISHVPQTIYLSDCSIAENIAFGLPKNQIDMKRVRYVAEIAKVSSFIESMPEEYFSQVGERGIKLSGGQCQRIGIARALYKHTKLLVLDEATSALDTITEQAVMKSLNQLSTDLTVVMIAHRLSTIESCDRLIKLESGHVIYNGPPKPYLDNH